MKVAPISSSTLHSRKGNGNHSFSYDFFSLLITLDESSELESPWWIGINDNALLSFNEEDYFKMGSNKKLFDRLKLYISNYTKSEVQYIKLLTGPRFLGYIFNPVSFYFIQFKDGSKASLVEIWNTFGEFKPVFVSSDHFDGELFKISFEKNFYISPFLPMDTKLELKYSWPMQGSQRIDIYSTREKESLYANWSYEDLNRSPVRYFPFSYLTTFAIHLQALKLFLKKIRFYKKTDDLHLQQGYFDGKSN